jgi:hypothetical protein
MELQQENSLNKQIQRQLLLKIKWHLFNTTIPPNNNPLYDELVLANRTDYIAAKDLVDVLLELDDPRLPSYFGVNNVGEYVGGVVGRASNYQECLNQAHVSLHLMLRMY